MLYVFFHKNVFSWHITASGLPIWAPKLDAQNWYTAVQSDLKYPLLASINIRVNNEQILRF